MRQAYPYVDSVAEGEATHELLRCYFCSLREIEGQWSISIWIIISVNVGCQKASVMLFRSVCHNYG